MPKERRLYEGRTPSGSRIASFDLYRLWRVLTVLEEKAEVEKIVEEERERVRGEAKRTGRD